MVVELTLKVKELHNNSIRIRHATLTNMTGKSGDKSSSCSGPGDSNRYTAKAESGRMSEGCCVGDGMRVSAKKWSAGQRTRLAHIFTIRFILTFAFGDGSRPK